MHALFSQRGEVQMPAGDSAPAPSTPQPWYSSLPADLQNDPTIKATPDVATLAKRFVDTNKEFGSRIKLPGKDAKPEEVQQLKAKLYEAGLFKAPPLSPDKYSLTRPETIPEKNWIPKEVEGKYRQVFHEYGVPDEMVQKLVQLRNEEIAGMTKAYEVDHAEANKFLDEYASGLKVDKAELMATGDRFLTKIFENNPKGLEFFKDKLAPEVMAAFGHAGLLMQESNGLTGEEFKSPPSTGKQEADDIISNRKNPKYEIYWSPNHPQHQEVRSYVEALYAKVFPGEQSV